MYVFIRISYTNAVLMQIYKYNAMHHQTLSLILNATAIIDLIALHSLCNIEVCDGKCYMHKKVCTYG